MERWVGGEEEEEKKAANDTLYLFGNTFGEEWEAFLSHYQRPPCATCEGTDGAVR